MAIIGNIWRDLRLTLGFFTRLPVGGEVESVDFKNAMARAMWSAPLAGLPVALLAAGVFALAHYAGLSPLISAALALPASILLTGALHEDGLADMVDGFGGGRDRAHRLEIMRDSRVGTYGVLALVGSFVLRLAALAQLAEPWPAMWALLAAHMGSRALLPAFMASLPPARPDGLSANVGKGQGRGGIIVALLLGMAGLAGLALINPMAPFVAAFVLALWFAGLRVLAKRQIGGHTGDVLGALQQGAEILVLLVACRGL